MLILSIQKSPNMLEVLDLYCDLYGVSDVALMCWVIKGVIELWF